MKHSDLKYYTDMIEDHCESADHSASQNDTRNAIYSITSAISELTKLACALADDQNRSAS